MVHDPIGPSTWGNRSVPAEKQSQSTASPPSRSGVGEDVLGVMLSIRLPPDELMPLLVSSDHGTSSHTSSHTSSKSFTCSAARFLSPLKRNYHEIKDDLFL